MSVTRTFAAAMLAAAPTVALAQQGTHPDTAKVQMDARARGVTHDRRAFGPDPDYGPAPYDYQAQLDIYGAKHLNSTQRPLIELGRELYSSGPFSKAPTPFGSHNIMIPQLLVYGDLRSAAGQTTVGDANLGRWANRLNLDVDLKLTATERIHALFRPLENKGQFTGAAFTGDSTGFKAHSNFDPAALFFEGDAGAMLGGLTGRDAPFDMPIAAGRMPLLFHNGIWIEDAFTGGALTIPARNSRALDWSNFDISFFYGGRDVSNPFVGDGRDHGQIAGLNTFIDAYHGYVEAGYAHVSGAKNAGRDFHSVALSFTRRWGGVISNSVRYIGAFGQTSTGVAGGAPTGREANGHLFLIESSLISSHPSTFVPYFNLFAGVDHPVSAARDPGAGGILKNTGINFEADALTAFPALDASATDAAGGALGLELLGSRLNSQIVLEVAGVYPTQTSVTMPGSQFSVGLRAQRVLNRAMIFRVDGMAGKRTGLSDIRGVRVELRTKF